MTSEVIAATINGTRYTKTVLHGQRFLVVEKRNGWTAPVVSAFGSIKPVLRQVRYARAAGFEIAEWSVAHVEE